MNIAEWLARSARRNPNAPALFEGDRLVCDYRALGVLTTKLAGALSQCFGIGAGDRVAIFLANTPEYLPLMQAVWWVGGVIVPINYRLHPLEATWIAGDCDAKLVIADENAANDLQPLLARSALPASVVTPREIGRVASEAFASPVLREGGDLAWLFYTSGTTGRPKGVMLSHDNLVAMSLAYLSDVDDVATADAALYAAPMSHGAGLYSMVHVLRQARHVVPLSGGVDAEEILSLASSLRNISMFAAPTMVRRLVDVAKTHSTPGDGLKTCVYGGGPMYLADIIEAVDVMGPRFVQIYGQGETPMTITALSRELIRDRSHSRWRERLASVGLAQSCVDVRIANETGQPMALGEVGEILVRGATVMLGYLNQPNATAEALKGGWLHTGDLGSIDEDGFLTLRDRSKDVIISGGTNIYPREVEEVLLTHAAVRECAVVGRPDAEWGEVVVAFVTLAPGATVNPVELDALCLDQIARFKRPKAYVVLDELPKNNYGKVLKTELRARLENS